MRSKRIKWLDFAKGLAILFVILAHWSSTFIGKSSGAFNDVVIIISYISYTCVMPMFFAISGYLYKRTTSIHSYILLCYKKVVSLLIPYLFFSIVSFIEMINQQNHVHLYSIAFGFRHALYLWFLIALFIIFLIVGLLDLLHINIYYQILIAFVLTLIQPDFWKFSNNVYMPLDLKYYIYYVASYALFFYLGVIINKLLHNSNVVKKINAIQFKKLYMYFAVWILILFIQSRFTSPMYQTDFLTSSDFITKMSIVIISFILFMKFSHNKLFNYFAYYGKYTIVIYLVHVLMISVLKYIMPTSVLFMCLLYMLGILIIWYFSIFICKLSQKSKIFNFIFYPRKYVTKLIINTKFGKYLFTLY